MKQRNILEKETICEAYVTLRCGMIFICLGYMSTMRISMKMYIHMLRTCYTLILAHRAAMNF